MDNFPQLAFPVTFPTVSWGIALLTGCFCLVVSRIVSSRAHPPFPPGPKGLPFVGNVLDMPLKNDWLTYNKWAKQYGPIVSVHILGQRLVFLNSNELCRELLETRSSIYMDRPYSAMLDMMGYASWLVGLLRPGQQWTSCRKLMAQHFNPQGVKKWRPYQVHEVHRLLVKLLDDPENFFHHVDRTVVGSLMLVLFGHMTPPNGMDDFVALHDQAVKDTGKALGAGAFLFNIFPGLRYLPDWVPGGGFQSQARAAFATSQKVLHQPLQVIRNNMDNGVANRSYVSSLLEDGEDEFTIKQTSATAYNAAVGGSKAVILSAILIMTLYPEVQRKAQQEIEKVTGGDKLPTFDDRDSLPYIKAFMKELFRWITPAPIGLPRRLMKDDVVKGYFIPAGSVIMTNTWDILHDENRFPKPLEFIPERYLDQDGNCPDPNLEGFGYGRRGCPGRYLIEEFAWIAVVSLLATFDVQKKLDANNRPITPVIEYSTGVVRGPKDFKTSIKPRSQVLVDLLREEIDNFPGFVNSE